MGLHVVSLNVPAGSKGGFRRILKAQLGSHGTVAKYYVRLMTLYTVSSTGQGSALGMILSGGCAIEAGLDTCGLVAFASVKRREARTRWLVPVVAPEDPTAHGMRQPWRSSPFRLCGWEKSRPLTSVALDSDVDENTKNTPTTSDRFPKYVDGQNTLKELSFIKWIAGFRLECRKISGDVSTELYFGLFDLFCQFMEQEMFDCRNKTNKSGLMKSYLEQIMWFFRGYYKNLKKDKRDTLDVIYYDGMSSMVAHYIDLELMSSQHFKENPSHIRISNKINTMLFIFLDQKLDYMFDSVFKLYYIFYSQVITNIESIMLPVCKKLLIEHPMPKNINFLTYMRYILCFKLWKKIITSSSSMDDSVKSKELDILTSHLRQLNVPNDFMSQHEKYNWPNWPNCPKLTMHSNEKQYSLERNLKNVSLFLYGESLPLKKCYKDILDAAQKKDISILLKPIVEQCKMLRPDLFAISRKELLKNWNEYFDDTLIPLIPTTPSCNSLMRKIKYNLVPTNDDLNKLKDFGEGSENHSPPNIDIFSHSDTKSIEKTYHINFSINKTIDESNYDKSKENEKSSGDASKTLITTFESFSANVKRPPPSEDEMQVNVKKSKSSEKQVLYENDGRFDPTLSNNPSRLNYISEITSTSNHPECSNSRGSKRNQCSPFSDNCKNEKNCRTKSMHEKSVLNCNPNQVIDSNCHNSNIENISRVTLNNDNSVLENPKNSHNRNGVSRLTKEPSVKENKWVTKASYPKLSITAVSNLKHTQSDFTVSDKDESVENSTKMIDSSIDQDGTVSPSQSDPYSQDFKRNSNVLFETSLSRINKSPIIEPNQQFQDLSNFIAPDHLSSTIQSGSEPIDEKTQIQSRAVHSFESISRTEPIEHQEMYRNNKISSQSKESSTSLSFAELLAAYNLFIDGRLVLCIHPKCIDSHHFHVLRSQAEILHHNFTVRFDYFRYHIQRKYKELLILNPRNSWSNIPELGQLTFRCCCKDCAEFESTVNLTQKILHAYYIEGKNSSIEEDNCENKQPTNRKILLSWKKHLARRFITEDYLENHSISQMTDQMEKHIKHFKYATQLLFH